MYSKYFVLNLSSNFLDPTFFSNYFDQTLFSNNFILVLYLCLPNISSLLFRQTVFFKYFVPNLSSNYFYPTLPSNNFYLPWSSKYVVPTFSLYLVLRIFLFCQTIWTLLFSLSFLTTLCLQTFFDLKVVLGQFEPTFSPTGLTLLCPPNSFKTIVTTL